MNGPVPLAWREAKFSSPALMFTGTRASCASAQRSDMMAMWPDLLPQLRIRELGLDADGVLVDRLAPSAMLSMRPAKSAGSSVLARAMLKTTSSAVSGVPS